MSWTLVSVLIPSHNYARYLREAIDSALGQTHPDVEVIVVDDGSTDESPAIIRSYGDRIRSVLKPNGGPVSALNAAFAESSGEIVCLLDADDAFEAEKVARVVAAARAMPDAYLIQHQLQLIDADGRPMHAPVPRRVPSGDLRERVIRTGGWFPHPVSCGLSFRRLYAEQLFPIPEHSPARPSARVVADTYLAGPAALLRPVAGIQAPLARRRKHSGNRSENVTGPTPEETLLNFEAETGTLAAVMAERFAKPLDLRMERHLDYQLVRHAAGQISHARAAACVLRSPMLPLRVRGREALRVWANRGMSARAR